MMFSGICFVLLRIASVARCARLGNLKPEFENASLLVYFGKALFQVFTYWFILEMFS
jgi:hypothetical protein